MVLVPVEHVEELKRLRENHAKLPPNPEVVETMELYNKMNTVLDNPGLTVNEKIDYIANIYLNSKITMNKL